MERMREVAKELVVGAAKAVNPNAKVIIKYPIGTSTFRGSGLVIWSRSRIFSQGFIRELRRTGGYHGSAFAGV